MDYKIYNLEATGKDLSAVESIVFSSTKNGLFLLNRGRLDLGSLGLVEKELEANYIVTVINRKISPEALSKVVDRLMVAHLTPVTICRLSGDEVTGNGIKSCYRIRAYSEDSLQELRENLKPVVDALDVDICVLPRNFPLQDIKLAVFDMDSTLIQCECIDELAKRCGIGEQVSSITASAMRGEINFNESFTRRMALLEGLSEDVLSDIGENLPLTEGVEHLIATLKENGYKIALFSGGFYYFANILKEKLGIDHVYANNLPIVDGKVTGKIEGEIVNGEKKKDRLKYVAELEGLDLAQTVAVGDGANDLPMIKTAGLGVAFHAKPLVREEAGLAVSTIGLDGLLYILGMKDKS